VEKAVVDRTDAPRTRASLAADLRALGVGYDRCTAFHLAEHRVPGAIAFEDGAPMTVDGKRAWRRFKAIRFEDERFPQIGDDFERTGAVARGRIGSAECRLFAAKPAVDFAAEWLRRARQ
jgi:aminoglycoside 3-N-acetyltransferase